MATTFVDYTGDGNATKSFSFPSYKVEDIKVDVDGVIKTVTTHYNITSYTTTGGGNVVFTSGNIPASPAAIRIFRDTDVDTAKATYTAGSSIKAGDLNNNMTQILYAAQEEQNQTILSSDIKDGAIKTVDIADSSITTAKIADANVTTAKLADSNVTTAKIADSNVTTAKIANSNVTTAKIADGNVTTIKIADATVTGAKILDGNITTAKLAENAVLGSKIANNEISASKLTSNSVTTAKILDANVTTAKIADSNVTTAKLAADAVNGTKIADDSINSEHYVDGSIDTAHIADTQITTAKLVDANVTTAKIADSNVTTAKIADANITAAKIASNAVTTDKIADGELTTLAGMQSGTASKLADSTALTADIADLNQIDGLTKQTTISDSDASFPTSGAVVDYVAAQLEPFGGFEAIANEVSFPNTQPASGVAISIADAAGIVVDGSNSSTTGRTVGGTTVTINNINSQFTSSTVASGIRFIVTSTGSGHVYNYHKSTLPESDLVNLSGDINDFNERYRVGSSNPTSSLDGGDLFFNTSTGKLLVYNSTNSAWEEAQSIGNFFISTLSPAFDGTTQDFTLTNAPTNAQQVILSINGVVQKPNAGSSAPSEGFALSGSTVKLSAAPATGSTYHAVVMGSTVNIGTPSNNTVTTAILQNGSVTTAKITDANVTTAKIADNAVTAAKIGTLTGNVDFNDNAYLTFGTGNDLKIHHSGTGSFIDHVGSGNGHLFIRGNGTDAIILRAKQGENSIACHSDGDVSLYYDNVEKLETTSTGVKVAGRFNIINNNITDTTNAIGLRFDSGAFIPTDGSGSPSNNSKSLGSSSYKFANVYATTFYGDGSNLTGVSSVGGSTGVDFNDNVKARFGTGNDLEILHDGTDSYLNHVLGSGILRINAAAGSEIRLTKSGPETLARFIPDGAVELYYDNVKKFETISTGAQVTGAFNHLAGSYTNGSGGSVKITHDSGKFTAGASDDARMYHDGSHSYFDSVTGHLYLYNHASGKAIIFGTEGNNKWQMYSSGHFVPDANNTYDIGTTSARVRNIYTNDLHLSNEGHSNDVDGTWGNWTIQEGESDLFLKNNRSGKKYKFNLTEVS